jgi:hypothetical protein
MSIKRTNTQSWCIGLVAALLTLANGPLLPLFQKETSNIYVNAIWDSLYGFGFSAGEVLFGRIVYDRSVGLLGFVIWPLTVFVLVTYSAARIASGKTSRRTKHGVAVAFVCSFMVLIPIKMVESFSLPSFAVSSFLNF